MNRFENTAWPQEASEAPQKHKLGVSAALIAVFTCVFCVIIVLFIYSYGSLRKAIQQERIDYVGEISNQLITGHHFMLGEYSDSVLRFAGIINRSRAESLADIAACFIPNDEHSIMLISEAGEIRDLSGRYYFITDRQITEKLCQSDGVTQLFASLNNEADFWLFATAIDVLQIDGQRYGTVVLAVPASWFSETLAISLFGNRGASYIIKRGGSIEIKPDDISMAFGGYNLFSSLSGVGAAEAQVAELQAAIDRGGTGSILIDIQGQDWLFGYNSIDEDNAIVVAIPLTLTAAKTYSGLSNTLLFMATAITLVALIALTVMLRFFYRDKERSRIAFAAQAKSSFFSKMSHDIRTPLNAVIGLQELIKGSSDIAAIQEYNEQSSVVSAYLLSILNDVLDMSRIESGGILLSHDPFDMNELLSEVSMITAGMADEKGIAFAAETDTAFETYYLGDSVRIKQVLMNLCNNAVKFTQPGGQIVMTVARGAGDHAADEVTLTVRDTGIGMSKEYLSKIFTPFVQEHSSFTQQYSGSGLGLAIVHSLVMQMGGTIDVKSELDKGSLFTVMLPLERGAAIPAAPAKAEPEKEPYASYAGKRVLLAEDNAINQMVAARLLTSKFDLQVETASNGEQAASMFAAAAPDYYDLILMDIKMPVTDGLAATRFIRALPRPDAKTIPIIALSANAYAQDVALSLEAGMNDHLSKPIDVKALALALEKYIDDN